MSCNCCRYNDGFVYTSNPPKYKCTIDNELHQYNYSCNCFEYGTDIVAKAIKETPITDSLTSVLQDHPEFGQYVTDSGIWQPMPQYGDNCSELVISKKAFVEAYEKWIKNNDQRRSNSSNN